LVEKLCEVWQLNEVDVEEELISTMPQKGTWQFTDPKIIDAKREKMMQALRQRDGLTLNKKGALCSTDDNTFRAVCTVSKRYARRAAPYWYGYSAEWRNFLRRVTNRFWYSAVWTVAAPMQCPPPTLRK
jgi:hypothetical protein